MLWGTTERRIKDHALQFDYIKKRDIPLRISDNFKLVELPSYVKSEEVLDTLKKSDFAGFKKLTPTSIESSFFNLQKELGVVLPISESNDDSRFLDKDFDKTEEMDIQ